MKPLDPTRRALLDTANRERTPDAATRAQVLASLLAVGASAGAGSAKAASATAGAGSAKAGLGLVQWIMLGGLGVAGVTAAFVWSSHTATLPVARPALTVATASVSASAIDARAPAYSGSSAPLGSGRVALGTSSTSSTNTPSLRNALDRELSLLQSAHSAYRAGQAGKALQLAQEHARLFPRSQLSAERRTIEVLSLCALGRTREARAVAGKLRAASGSPSLAGLDESCAGK